MLVAAEDLGLDPAHKHPPGFHDVNADGKGASSMPSVDVEEDDIAALGGEAEEEEQDDGLRFQRKQMTTQELTASLAALEAPAAMDSSAFSGRVDHRLPAEHPSGFGQHADE